MKVWPYVRSCLFLFPGISQKNSSVDVPFEVTQDTRLSILKLHISDLEMHFIQEQKYHYDYGDSGIRFDQAALLLAPSKIIVRNDETISVQLSLIATANPENSRKGIKRMILNGQEVTFAKDGWKIDIAPTVKEKGLVPYPLAGEVYTDDGTAFKAKYVIYIQNSVPQGTPLKEDTANK